jgi:hypothetical protein
MIRLAAIVLLSLWSAWASAAQCVEYDAANLVWTVAAPTMPQTCFEYGQTNGVTVEWSYTSAEWEALFTLDAQKLSVAWGAGFGLTMTPLLVVIGAGVALRWLRGRS